MSSNCQICSTKINRCRISNRHWGVETCGTKVGNLWCHDGECILASSIYVAIDTSNCLSINSNINLSTICIDGIDVCIYWISISILILDGSASLRSSCYNSCLTSKKSSSNSTTRFGTCSCRRNCDHISLRKIRKFYRIENCICDKVWSSCDTIFGSNILENCFDVICSEDIQCSNTRLEFDILIDNDLLTSHKLTRSLSQTIGIR